MAKKTKVNRGMRDNEPRGFREPVVRGERDRDRPRDEPVPEVEEIHRERHVIRGARER